MKPLLDILKHGQVATADFADCHLTITPHGTCDNGGFYIMTFFRDAWKQDRIQDKPTVILLRSDAGLLSEIGHLYAIYGSWTYAMYDTTVQYVEEEAPTS